MVDLSSYDFIIISSSSGKDSQVMLDQVALLAESEGVEDRVIVIHADLGPLEWPGAPELAEEQADFYGVDFIKTSRIGTKSDGSFRAPNIIPKYEEGEKRGDLLEEVLRRFRQIEALRDHLVDIDRGEFVAYLEDYISNKKVKALEKGVIQVDRTSITKKALTELTRGKSTGVRKIESTPDHWVVTTDLGRAEEVVDGLRDHGVDIDDWWTQDLDSLPPEVLEQLYQDRLKVAPPWYSPKSRYCTADFKRGPLLGEMGKLVDKWHKDRKKNRLKPRPCRILDCQGLRAEESPGRKKKPAFSTRKSNKNVRMDTWLPIHQLTEVDVWNVIAESGAPYHPAYDLGLEPGDSADVGGEAWQKVKGKLRKVWGMPRLSCVYCIYSPWPALLLAAKAGGDHAMELLERHIDVEDETGFTYKQDLSLREVLEAAIDPDVPIEPMTGDWNM